MNDEKYVNSKMRFDPPSEMNVKKKYIKILVRGEMEKFVLCLIIN